MSAAGSSSTDASDNPRGRALLAASIERLRELTYAAGQQGNRDSKAEVLRRAATHLTALEQERDDLLREQSRLEDEHMHLQQRRQDSCSSGRRTAASSYDSLPALARSVNLSDVPFASNSRPSSMSYATRSYSYSTPYNSRPPSPAERPDLPVRRRLPSLAELMNPTTPYRSEYGPPNR